MKKYSGTT